MIVLGIDPGYAIIGYGVLDTNKSNMLVDYGAIITPKEDSMPVRLENIDKSLKYLFEKFKPDVVAIEELFYFKNQKTVIQVAQARGVILLACQKYCGNIYEYTPLQINKRSLVKAEQKRRRCNLWLRRFWGLIKFQSQTTRLTHLQLPFVTASQVQCLTQTEFRRKYDIFFSWRY